MPNGSYRPAPGVWDGMPVADDDAFFSLERPPGWKYELWDGRLRIEPDWRYHVARWSGRMGREAPEGASIRSASGEDQGDLVSVADASFADGPDFFRWPPAVRRKSLRQSVKDAITLEPDWVTAAHQIARSRDDQAVGLLLVREVEGGVTLETVGVVPDWRRAGLAAAMFEKAVAALPVEVEVRSAWLVANRESAAWHQDAGFETVPTSVSLRSVLRATQWTRRVPILSDEGMAAEAEIRQLERDEREGRAPDPFTLARPVHRRPPA